MMAVILFLSFVIFGLILLCTFLAFCLKNARVSRKTWKTIAKERFDHDKTIRTGYEKLHKELKDSLEKNGNTKA